MENEFTTALSPQIRLLLAAAPVLIFVIWGIAKRLKPVRSLLDGHPWALAAVDLVLFPVAASGAGGLVAIFFRELGFSTWESAIHDVTSLVVLLAIGTGMARIAELWIISQKPDGQEVQLSQLVKSLLYGAFYFLSLLVFLALHGYSIAQISVSTGLLAAVLGFAMQQTLGDLLSGISMSIERPFKIGDWLRLNEGMEGEVVDINWRTTRLRCWDNTTYVIPNGQLAKMSFTNLHGAKHLFAPWYLVRISGDADPKRITNLLETAARRCDAILQNPVPLARLMDGATIPYTYMVWVHFPNYPAMFEGREQLYREIHRELQSAGLQISADIQEIRHRPVNGAAISTEKAQSIKKS